MLKQTVLMLRNGIQALCAFYARKFITSDVMISFSSGYDSAIMMVVATRELSLMVFWSFL